MITVNVGKVEVVMMKACTEIIRNVILWLDVGGVGDAQEYNFRFMVKIIFHCRKYLFIMKKFFFYSRNFIVKFFSENSQEKLFLTI